MAAPARTTAMLATTTITIIKVPLDLLFPGIGFRKLVSEYLMKHPVFSALPSDQGKHPNKEFDAFWKHALQELAFSDFQQSARTYTDSFVAPESAGTSTLAKLLLFIAFDTACKMALLAICSNAWPFLVPLPQIALSCGPVYS